MKGGNFMKKIFLFLIFSSFVFCNQNEKPEIEIIDNSVVNSIDNSNEENKIYENSDFLKIQLQKYKNVREFYYFSRWHKYLKEIEEENYRKKEYENAMAQYENDLKNYNEKVKSSEFSEVPEGEAVNIEKINQNLEDE